jgi:hypothetical protein
VTEFAPSRLDTARLDRALADLRQAILEGRRAVAVAAPRDPDEVVRRTPGNGAGGNVSLEVLSAHTARATESLSLTAGSHPGAGGSGVGASPPPPPGGGDDTGREGEK